MNVWCLQDQPAVTIVIIILTSRITALNMPFNLGCLQPLGVQMILANLKSHAFHNICFTLQPNAEQGLPFTIFLEREMQKDNAKHV